jgi:hypothetical protein
MLINIAMLGLFVLLGSSAAMKLVFSSSGGIDPIGLFHLGLSMTAFFVLFWRSFKPENKRDS